MEIERRNAIDLFEIKTFSGFNEVSTTSKHKRTTQEELDNFCKLYTGFRINNIKNIYFEYYPSKVKEHSLLAIDEKRAKAIIKK